MQKVRFSEQNTPHRIPPFLLHAQRVRKTIAKRMIRFHLIRVFYERSLFL